MTEVFVTVRKLAHAITYFGEVRRAGGLCRGKAGTVLVNLGFAVGQPWVSQRVCAGVGGGGGTNHLPLPPSPLCLHRPHHPQGEEET